MKLAKPIRLNEIYKEDLYWMFREKDIFAERKEWQKRIEYLISEISDLESALNTCKDEHIREDKQADLLKANLSEMGSLADSLMTKLRKANTTIEKETKCADELRTCVEESKKRKKCTICKGKKKRGTLLVCCVDCWNEVVNDLEKETKCAEKAEAKLTKTAEELERIANILNNDLFDYRKDCSEWCLSLSKKVRNAE